MLQNTYFLAKIGVDTAENEQHFAEILPIGRGVAGAIGPGPRPRAGPSPRPSTAPAGTSRPARDPPCLDLSGTIALNPDQNGVETTQNACILNHIKLTLHLR